MKVINTFNYEPLNSVQSKYFFGYTGGENPKMIATSKQLWKMQDLSNKIYHYYFCIETFGEKINHKNNLSVFSKLQNQMSDTKKVIDEMTEVSLPISLENMNTKIKLLTELLESALPKLQKCVEEALEEQSA